MPLAAQWPKPVLLLQSWEKNGLGLCFQVMPLSLTAENTQMCGVLTTVAHITQTRHGFWKTS